MIKSRSLGAQLLAIYLPIFTAVLIALFALLEYQYYQDERSELTANLTNLVAVQGPVITDAVWEYDTVQIVNQLTTIGNLDYVLSATVYNPIGEPIAYFGETESRPEDLQLYATQDLYWELINGREHLGQLEVIAHTGAIRKELIEHIQLRAITLLVLIMALSIGTLYATRKVINRPLETMKAAMKLSATDATLTPVSWPNHDELGDLVSAYNEMQARRAEAEKEVSHYQAHLESLVEERTKELATAHDKMKMLNDQKDKFFSIIAHDLKGPFNALLGFSSLLSNETGHIDRNKAMEYASSVHESGQQVFKLLENLLEWSRLQMGKMGFAPGPVSLKVVIESNVELFQSIAVEKKIQLTSTDMKPLIVFADAHMVDTIVRNLINNAIKFTPEKGEVTISTLINGNRAEVEVFDTGIGMSADKLILLFQLGENTSTKGTNGETGTGLGLHLSKDLIERQGGQIHVESTEGKGSTFRFNLPMFRE